MNRTVSSGVDLGLQLSNMTGNYSLSNCTTIQNNTVCKGYDPKTAHAHFTESSLSNVGNDATGFTVESGSSSANIDSGSTHSTAGSAQADQILAIGVSGQDNSGAVHVQQVQGSTGPSSAFSLEMHTTQTTLASTLGTSLPTSPEMHKPDGGLNAGSGVGENDSGSGTINTGPAAAAAAGAAAGAGVISGGGSSGPGTSSESTSGGIADTRPAVEPGQQLASDGNIQGAGQSARPPRPPSPKQEPPVTPVDQGWSESGTGQPGNGHSANNPPQPPPQQQITVGGTVLDVIPHATIEAHTTATNSWPNPGVAAGAGSSGGPEATGNPDQGFGPADPGHGIAHGDLKPPQDQGENGGSQGASDSSTSKPGAPVARPGQADTVLDTIARPVAASGEGVIAGSPLPSLDDPSPPSAAAVLPAKSEPPVIITHNNRPIAVQPLAPEVVTTGSITITQPPKGTNFITSAGQVFSPIPSSSLSFSTSSGMKIPVAIIPAPSSPSKKISTDAIGHVHIFTLSTSSAMPVPLKPAPQAVTTTDESGHTITSVPGLIPSSSEGVPIPGNGNKNENKDSTASIIPIPTLPPGIDIQAFQHPAFVTATSTSTSGSTPKIQELIPVPNGDNRPSLLTISGTPVAVIPVEPTSTITASGSVIEIFPASPLFISHAGSTEAVLTVPLAAVATRNGNIPEEEISFTTSGTRVFAIVPTPTSFTTAADTVRTLFTTKSGTVLAVGTSTIVPMTMYHNGSAVALPTTFASSVVSASAGSGGDAGNGNGNGNGTTYAIPSKISVGVNGNPATTAMSESVRPTSGGPRILRIDGSAALFKTTPTLWLSVLLLFGVAMSFS